jgi:LPXTG-site transpeptidase (sortase) family protein
LTAHSSWYPNDVLPYGLSSAFALLDKLVVGDKIYIFNRGEMYVYKVRDKFTVKPTDVSVLNQPSDKREMTLMTCTPIGTAINRLIVKLDLIYPIVNNSNNDEGDIKNLYTDGELHA